MKLFQFLLIISFLLTACSPQVTVTSEVIATAQTEIVIPTLIATPTLNPDQALQSLEDRIVAGEQIDLSRLTIEQQTRLMDGLADQHLAGNLREVSGLTFEQRKAFALVIDEKKDAQRGDNPIIYTDRNGDKFYVDPVTLDFAPIDDGTTAEQQTIDNTLPRVVDAEGSTHVYHNDEWIKIAGSDKIQLDNFEDFPWPDTEIVDPKWIPEKDKHLIGLTIPEYVWSYPGYTMTPIFFLEKVVGEINIPGYSSDGTLLGYVMNENDPFSVRAVQITGAPSLYGDNLKADSSYTITETSNFFKALETATLYYVMYEADQQNAFATGYPGSDGKEVTADYEGLIPSHLVHDVITGKLDNDNLALLRATLLVEEGKKSGN